VWDHLIQDYDPTRDNYGVVADHPELVDVNGWVEAGKSIHPFWNHMNSIDYNPDEDQIVLSVRGSSELWVIDHSTTSAEAAGHTGGRSGKGGDLLYRWGNPETYDAPGSQMLFDQHDAQWIEPGYGTDRVHRGQVNAVVGCELPPNLPLCIEAMDRPVRVCGQDLVGPVTVNIRTPEVVNHVPGQRGHPAALAVVAHSDYLAVVGAADNQGFAAPVGSAHLLDRVARVETHHLGPLGDLHVAIPSAVRPATWGLRAEGNLHGIAHVQFAQVDGQVPVELVPEVALIDQGSAHMEAKLRWRTVASERSQPQITGLAGLDRVSKHQVMVQAIGAACARRPAVHPPGAIALPEV